VIRKNEFIKSFHAKTGKEALDFYNSKDYKGFVECLDKWLKNSFRAAVEEAECNPKDPSDPSAGLSNLFGDM